MGCPTNKEVAMAYLLKKAVERPNFLHINFQELHVTEMAGGWAYKKCNRCDTCRHNGLTPSQSDALTAAVYDARALWLESDA